MAGDDGTDVRRGLGRELRVAMKLDDAYAKTDEMKKRAIHTARDYDEFRNMVACATLTPVSSKELASLRKGKKGWSHAAAARRSGAGGREGPARQRRGRSKAALRRGVPQQAPRTGMEFLRDWRRCCGTPEKKRAYLSVVGPSAFEELFRADLDAQVLAQVLSALHGAPAEEDGAAALPLERWLLAISRTGRFDLNMAFLDNDERAQVAELLHLSVDRAKGDGGGSDVDSELQRAYATNGFAPAEILHGE